MAKPKWFGFGPPFLSNGNILPAQQNERLIKNDLLQLLLTSPGERVFRPDFGTALPTYPFELTDDASSTELRLSMLDAIQRFEPRVDVTDLTIDLRPEENLVNIVLHASLTVDPALSFIVELKLPINETEANNQPIPRPAL